MLETNIVGGRVFQILSSLVYLGSKLDSLLRGVV